MKISEIPSQTCSIAHDMAMCVCMAVYHTDTKRYTTFPLFMRNTFFGFGQWENIAVDVVDVGKIGLRLDTRECFNFVKIFEFISSVDRPPSCICLRPCRTGRLTNFVTAMRQKTRESSDSIRKKKKKKNKCAQRKNKCFTTRSCESERNIYECIRFCPMLIPHHHL